MEQFTKHRRTLEMHTLERHFAVFRLQEPSAIRQLYLSIAQMGQQLPVVVVPEKAQTNRWLLIDGYRRVQALVQCGRDTVEAEVWSCSPQEALLNLLAQGQQRSWSVIEEAGLIQTLQSQYGCTQSDIAHRLGRDKSWVSRRLSLLNEIGDEVAAEVYRGVLSPWVAQRVIVPLARANPEHSVTLLNHLKRNPHPTRALKAFFEHYKRSNHQVREKMVTNPTLFFKSLEAQKQSSQAALLTQGPEGQWEERLRNIIKQLRPLHSHISTVFYQHQPPGDQKRLVDLMNDCRQQFEQLNITLRRHLNDISENQRNGSDATCERHADQGNRAVAEVIS